MVHFAYPANLFHSLIGEVLVAKLNKIIFGEGGFEIVAAGTAPPGQVYGSSMSVWLAGHSSVVHSLGLYVELKINLSPWFHQLSGASVPSSWSKDIHATSLVKLKELCTGLVDLKGKPLITNWVCV